MLSIERTNMPLSTIVDLDEDHDENKDIKEFYEKNLPSLKKCSMDLIKYSIIRDIAVMINATKSDNEEWRKYAEEMGMDNKTIAVVKAQAYCHRDLEIFIAMDRIVRQRLTFGHVIDALLKTERFDILKEIEPYVKSLLPRIPQKEDSSSALMICKNKIDGEEDSIIKKETVSFNEQKCENNYFQQHSINNYFKKALRISDSTKLPEESLEGKEVPSAPMEENLTVLIQHAESENNIAEDLAKEFSVNGIVATTLTEVNDLATFEPVNILDTVFNEVDFIVPILSEKFMEEIHPQNHEEYLDSPFAQNNRRLYTLIMHEYAANRCVNFRVRPVIVEGMSHRPGIVDEKGRKRVREPIFAFPFRLPKEVSKLIRVLKKSKQIRTQ